MLWKRFLGVVALAGLLLGAAAPVLAEVGDVETDAFGDAAVYKAGCGLDNPELHVVGDADLQASAHLFCDAKANDTRIGHVQIAEKNANGTYRVFMDLKLTPNKGNNSADEIVFTDVNTSCIPAAEPHTYAVLISMRKQGGNPDRDQSADYVLNIKNCT